MTTSSTSLSRMDGNDIDIITEERCATPPSPGLGTIVHVEQPQQPYDEDEHSGELREYNGVFEGPEKTLGKSSDWGVRRMVELRNTHHHVLIPFWSYSLFHRSCLS